MSSLARRWRYIARLVLASWRQSTRAALAHELFLQGLRFEQFKKLPVRYKGILVGDYEADFVVENEVILELKAVSALRPEHEAQAHHYLAATGLRLAILLNFGEDSLKHKRIVR